MASSLHYLIFNISTGTAEKKLRIKKKEEIEMLIKERGRFFLHKEDGSKSDKYGSKIEYKTKVVVFFLTVLKNVLLFRS